MDRKKIFDMTDGRCFYCGKPLDFENFHLDHFIPKASGGKIANNLVPSCPDCNIAKSDLTIEEFRWKIHDYAVDTLAGRMVTKYFVLNETVYNTPVSFYYEVMDIEPPKQEWEE